MPPNPWRLSRIFGWGHAGPLIRQKSQRTVCILMHSQDVTQADQFKQGIHCRTESYKDQMSVASVDSLLAVEEFFHDQAVHEGNLLQIQYGVFGLRHHILQSLDKLWRVLTGQLVLRNMDQSRVGCVKGCDVQLHGGSVH